MIKLTGFKLLAEALKKLTGSETPNNLTAEEKQTYQHWEAILGETITVENVVSYLNGEITRLRDIREKEEKDPLDDIHRAQLINYKQLLAIISAPDRQREALEKQLQAMVEQGENKQGEKET